MNIKSVELIRNVRDENYNNCKNMNTWIRPPALIHPTSEQTYGVR